MRKANGQLRKFLYQNLYFHPEVSEPNERGCEMIERVFKACMENPERMGDYARSHSSEQGLKRIVCDYISGMTDRYIAAEFAKLERDDRGRDDALSCAAPPSEPDKRFSRIRLSS